MHEYTIKQIDVEGPPNEWNGPKGKVYYISVMLDGHDKPVGIGKKTPDALKVGDRVFGEIIETEFLSDKWKHGTRPEATPNSTREIIGKSEKPDYEPSTNTRWAIKMSFDSYVKVSGTPPDDDSSWVLIKENAQRLLDMFEDLRNSGSGDAVTSPNPSIKESESPAAGYDKFKKAKAELNDEPEEDWTQGLTEEYPDD